jgi:predicted cobalt transporter CbtA
LLLLFAASILPSSGLACSLVSAEASTTAALATSALYWSVSILLGGIIICLEIYQRHWPFISIVTAVLLIFHPHRTVRPIYWPDCNFINVQASQAVLAALLAILAYRLLGMFLAYRRSKRSTA